MPVRHARYCVIIVDVRFRRRSGEDVANSRDSERAAPDDIFDIVGVAFAGLGTESDLLRRVVSDAPVGIALLDADLRWQYVNAEFTRATGLRAADIIGLPIARTPFARHADTFASVLADGLPRGTALGGRADPLPGIDLRCRRLELQGQAAGIIVVVADSGAYRHPQDPVRSHDRLTMLDAATQRIGTTLDIDTTCAELVEFTAPGMADLAIVGLWQRRAAGGTSAFPDPSCLRRVAVACAPRVRPWLVSLADPGEPVSYGPESPIGRSLRAGMPVVTDLRGTEPGDSDTSADATVTVCRAAGLGTTPHAVEDDVALLAARVPHR